VKLTGNKEAISSLTSLLQKIRCNLNSNNDLTIASADSSFVGKTTLFSLLQQLISFAKPNILVILRHEGSAETKNTPKSFSYFPFHN